MAQTYPTIKHKRQLMGSKKYRLSLVFGFTVLLISGCTIRLAPQFDQQIVDNLSNTSIQLLEHLAAVSGGVSKSDFEKRAETYNNLIGEIEALELRIKARPVPESRIGNKVINKANETLQKKGITTLLTANDIAPSATALSQIRKNIETMKKADAENGLSPTEVQAFKGNIVLFLDQALTYERHLNP